MRINAKAAVFITILIIASVPAAFGAADELDAVIRELSDYLNTRIPKGNKAVFLNVTSEWPAFSEYVLDCLQENAVNDGAFAVVDRQQLDVIRAEQNFQYSGEVSYASAQEIGQLLGAQTIVSGLVTKVGSQYRIQVRAIAVQTAALQGLTTRNVGDKGQIVTALTAQKAPAPAASSVSPAAQTPAVPDTPAYRIGDIGPAGGIVFYDKGDNSGGWRYLEAAPANTEKEPVIPMADLAYGSIRERGLGAGKENTVKLLEILKRKGGGVNTASWICDQLEVNGFNDWYQPSLDELIMLYKNTYGKDKSGGFRPMKYWTSTCQLTGAAYVVDFSNGKEGFARVNEKTRVRAIRRF